MLQRVATCIAIGVSSTFVLGAPPPAAKPQAAPTATTAPKVVAPTPSATAKPADPTDPDEIREGHSYHGEAFDDGPRQAAYLMPGMGNVDFRVTTKSPEAQKFFNQGLAQLHGFWYFEAERSFRQAAALDPDCAMAY